MIVIKVELHHFRSSAVENIGTMVIDNIGVSSGGRRGNYRVRVARRGGGVMAAARNPVRTGEVKDYPRLSYNVWRLVLRALKSAFPEEK